MAILFRSFLILFQGLVGIAAAAIALAWYLAAQSLPDYDRTYRIQGVDNEVEIVRDRYAVPHILSDGDNDAYFSLGFVHAQDRLWQMTLLRRAAQGRLSELFGRETLHIDTLMRSLDLHSYARRAVPLQSEQTLAALKAYSRGVNERLRVVQQQALGRGAPELFLFDSAIAPWTPADSIAVQKLMALRLSGQAAAETLRARLSLVLPQERLRDILPDSPDAPVMGLPRITELFPDLEPQPVKHAARHPLDPLAPAGMAGASNAFAATSRRTARGAPLLATDPHLGLEVPSIWYLARMNLESGAVIGGTIPGIPAVLIGRNSDLGWGLTSSYLDDQDVYIEKLNRDDPEEYLTPTGYKPFVTRNAIFRIKNEEDLIVKLRWTRHGPVIPGDHFDAADVTPPGHVASLAWTGFDDYDRSVGAAIRLMQARSIPQAREAARDLRSPSQMITLADKSSVALLMAGSAPRRNALHTSQGRIPAPGWLAVNDWQGMRPFSSNPWVSDPPSGIVVNTNNRITDAKFPDHLSHNWGDSTRIDRAARLLGAREFHSLESFIETQTDIVSEAARDLLPLVARDLWYSGTATSPDSLDERREQALERLATWNGSMSEHDPEPLIYAAWMRALQRRLTIDELGSLVRLIPRAEPVFLERVFRDINGASVWCDVIQTSQEETCAEISRRALDDALIELEQRFGPRLESWRWGDAHQAVHRNQTFGRKPVVRLLANIRQSTPGGDHTLLRGVSVGEGEEPYLNVHGSSLRAVYDFSDPDSSVFISSTGQSGHLISQHYDDLAELWRRSEYIPMSLDVERARAGGVGTTLILPGGNGNRDNSEN